MSTETHGSTVNSDSDAKLFDATYGTSPAQKPVTSQDQHSFPPSAEVSPPVAVTAEGLIEVFGRQEAAGCLVFGGWLASARPQVDRVMLSAVFERGTLSGEAYIASYERADLVGQGVGLLVLMLVATHRLGRFLRLTMSVGTVAVEMKAAIDARELPGRAISDRAQAIVQECASSENLATIRSLVSRRFVGEGYIDAYGYHAPSSGWFFCGWVSNDWAAHSKEAGDVLARFEGQDTRGTMILNFYDREDVRGKGVGFVLYLSSDNSTTGRLLDITLRAGPAMVVARPSVPLSMIAAEFIVSSFGGLIAGSDIGATREHLRELLARKAYDGHDTVADLSDQIFIEFDEVIDCRPDGVVLMGWLLAVPGVIRAIRMRSATAAFPIDLDKNVIWTNRPDVIESVGREKGFSDTACGFIIRVPAPGQDDQAFHLEIETASSEVAYKTLPRGRLKGVAAIKRILSDIEIQYKDVDALFDNVIGPPIAALNTQRLQIKPRVSTLRFGLAPMTPRYSVIVPLYGRIDYMQMQIALFATLGVGSDVELIYVLDDPPKTREAQFLAASLYARFKVPFKLLCLSHNVGFAPANNIGLASALGEFICFLNSDVFPTTGDWLDRLAADLLTDPTLGVVGPMLLFEDGSIQHQGLYFKRLPQYGSWYFPHHTRKGFRPPNDKGLRKLDAITGAAMLLRRETALHCGGFDEAFAIGDFEDADLCFKIRDSGLSAAVDLGVPMYHLERKSQASSVSLWRSNLTLFNAWIHQRRWGNTVAEISVAS